MTTIEVDSIPYWNFWIVIAHLASGLVVFFIWSWFARKSRRDADAVGYSVFLTVATLLAGIGTSAGVWTTANGSVENTSIKQSLMELGYENVQNSRVDFTASFEGQYVEGKLEELPGKPNTLQVRRYEYVE